MADRGRFEACAALCTQRESVRSTGGGGDEFALVHDCARIAESWINAQGVAQNVVRTPPARRCKEAKLSTNSTPAIQEGSHTHKRPADGHSLAHLLSCSHAESRIFRTRRLSDCASGATMDVAVGTGDGNVGRRTRLPAARFEGYPARGKQATGMEGGPYLISWLLFSPLLRHFRFSPGSDFCCGAQPLWLSLQR